jgi:serine/threonine protein kinase
MKNVIKVLNIYEDINKIYIVTEYMGGGCLPALFKDKNHNKGNKLINITKQIVTGLSELGSFNIIHRDLKPENILINEDGTLIKIADFGFGRILSENESIEKQQCGTLLYKAPEILLNENYDHKIDVWSLGVILYYILTGIYPFDYTGNEEL